MYTFLGIHFRRWAWLLSPLSFLFRVRLYPEVGVSNDILNLSEKSIVYVLPTMSIMDVIVLNKTLKKLKQKKINCEANSKQLHSSSILALKPRSLIFNSEKNQGFSYDVVHLIENNPPEQSKKIVFVPISVFWSRSAEREEKGYVLRSLFPDDGTGNGLQKLWMLLLHRGEVNIAFGKPLHLDSFLCEEECLDKKGTSEKHYSSALKIKRLLNIEFAKERTAAFGPTLYDKEKINNWILSSQNVSNLIKNSDNKIKTKTQIISLIKEISANYNYITVRALEKLFDFLWNNVFDGVKVRNFESVERYAKDSQIIWMPSHRSHFDYLLLSYVLFKKGLVTPHVAAGINLNFWPVGSILRQAGAFFIRRSFSGNKLYAHAFSEYVNFLLQNSFPIEFFQEGGRSRIGKLLSPKLGMLSICVHSILSRKAENTYFIPVYFGYDKVMEDDSYARELKGTKKQQENTWQFLNGIRKVFVNYGSVDVSFGEPVKIGDIWEDYYQKLRRENPLHLNIDELFPQKITDFEGSIDQRDPKIHGFIKYLAKRVNQKINCAATASLTAILSTALLSTAAEKIPVAELKYEIILLHWLANKFGENLKWRVATNTTEPHLLEYLTSFNAPATPGISTHLQSADTISEQYFKMGEKWHFIAKKAKVENNNEVYYSKNMDKEFNFWWYRGTSFHVFAGFGFIAFYLLNSQQEKITISYIESHMGLIRHLWQDELFWDSKTSTLEIVKACLNAFEQVGFVTLEESTIHVVKKERVQQSLQFLLDIISPERELYGIQAAAAIDLFQQKGSFSKEELLNKSIALQGRAYSKNIVRQSALLSKSFGNRVFDAYYKHKVYVPSENQKISIDTTLLGPLQEFLDLPKFTELL